MNNKTLKKAQSDKQKVIHYILKKILAKTD